MKKQDYISLIAKGLTNEINLQEAETLNSMRNSDQAFSSTYDELQEIWDAAGDYTPTVSFDSATAYDKFAAKYQIPNDYGKSSNSNYKKLLTGVIAALLISSSVFVYFNNIKSDTLTNDSTKVETIVHNQDNITLSPGAELAFNNDGSVKDVVGNVYFENNKDVTIDLNNESIVSEGASFNVSKAEGSNKLRVDVKEGTIVLKGKDGSNENISQKSSLVYDLSNNTYEVLNVTDGNNYLLWTSNKLSFNNTNIDIVFQEMEQFFGIKINVDGIVPTDCHLTSLLVQNASVSKLFELLRTTFKFNITQTGDGEFEVSSISCK